jgi:hypothetical protein
MLRHNHIRDIPRRSRYERNTQPTPNQILSRRLTETLYKLYNTLKNLQDLTNDDHIDSSDIIQLRYMIDYVEKIMLNNTTVELIRPPLYFPYTKLHYIRH